jgi:small-conductance mechanosensitive channel
MGTFLAKLELYIWPLALLVGCIIIGLSLEIFFTVKLRRIIARNNWLAGGRVLKALRGITFIIFLGIGVYLFVLHLDIAPAYENYLNKSLIIALILAATILAARIANALLNAGSDKEKSDFQGTSIIENVTKVVVYSIGFIIILQTLDISVAPILTALGVGGLAVALAMQDTLSNLFAGIFIIASKKVRIGDYIKLQSGEEGTVEDINWRTITINETSETTVVVPNSKLSTAIFKNFDLPTKEIIFPVQLMVGYENDLHKVEMLAIEAAKSVIATSEFCDKNHIPLVRYHTFTEAGIQLSVIFRVLSALGMGPVRHEYIKSVMKIFAKNDIQVSEKAITLRNAPREEE